MFPLSQLSNTCKSGVEGVNCMCVLSPWSLCLPPSACWDSSCSHQRSESKECWEKKENNRRPQDCGVFYCLCKCTNCTVCTFTLHWFQTTERFAVQLSQFVCNQVRSMSAPNTFRKQASCSNCVIHSHHKSSECHQKVQEETTIVTFIMTFHYISTSLYTVSQINALFWGLKSDQFLTKSIFEF